MKVPEVIVLFDGYSKILDNGKMDANCSCTLIKGEKNIIVDTMTAWDKEKIITALGVNGVKPEEIDFVICTHGHADHIGNNNLFINADHIIGNCFQRRTIFSDMNLKMNDYQICDGVKVILTEGHTHDDITVIVQTKIDEKDVQIAIVGDLFEKEEDIEDSSLWKNLGIPELQSKQIENRKRVFEQADYIVPGHGIMFKISDDMRIIINQEWKKIISRKE